MAAENSGRTAKEKKLFFVDERGGEKLAAPDAGRCRRRGDLCMSCDRSPLPQGESGAAATEKTRVLRVECRADIKIARGGRFVPSASCYRLKLTGPLRPVHISIPALRAEGDFFEPAGQSQTFIPAFTQRVTGLAVPFVQGQQTSTHTLRVEGDCPLPSTTSTRWTSFYPRPPHGGRHETAGWRSSMCTISIHALRMEGDSKHAEVQACISAAYLKCSTRKAAASRRCAGLGGQGCAFSPTFPPCFGESPVRTPRGRDVRSRFAPAVREKERP